MASTKFYGTGRRKSSVARVYLVPGTGKITKNPPKEIFGRVVKYCLKLYVLKRMINVWRTVEHDELL